MELMRGVFSGNLSRVRRMLAKLDAHGAGDLVNRCEQPGMSALSVACEKGWVEVVRCLLRHPAIDARAVTDARSSVLHVAGQSGHAAVVRVLLEDGRVDVNALATPARITALMVTSKHGKLEAAAQLIAAGADLDVKDSVEGKSALVAATVGGHVEAMRALLVAGADPWAVDRAGRSADYWAAHGQQPEDTRRHAVALVLVFQLVSTFFTSLLCGHIPTFVLPKADFASMDGFMDDLRHEVLPYVVNAPLDDDSGGITLAWSLCARGHADALEYLLETVPVTAVTLAESKTGSAPLHKASEVGHAAVVRVLLAHPGVDVNQRTASADAVTPLVLAAFHGHAEVIALLLRAGADPGIPWTPQPRLGAGGRARERQCKSYSWTPAQVARARGHRACADLIETSAPPAPAPAPREAST